MKRLLAVLALAAPLLSPIGIAAAEHHVKANLVEIGDSGVTGQVQLVQMPHGGTNTHVIARGLKPGQQYTSFYYANGHCSSDPEDVGTFTADASGLGQTNTKVDDDLDEIGSVSVRTPDYQTIFACAHIR